MATKNLFVYVPSNAAANFIAYHTGNGITTADDYYKKVAFLEGQGTIATHGQIFGMSKAFSDEVNEFKNKVGLTNEFTTSNTLTSYVKTIGGQVDVLNGADSVAGSVDYKIKTAIDALVSGAPLAYDTITEIAAWIVAAQKNEGSAEALATTLAQVPVLQNQLGTYSTGTYSGAYLFAYNAAADAVTEFANTLAYSDTAVAGKYVSAVSISNTGEVTVNREDLPEISVNQNSTNYLTTNEHEIGALISSISTSTGISSTTSANMTSYSAGTETIGDGLITASNVYNRIHATEVYVASALTTLDTRITSVVANATGELDSTITLDDANSYGSVTIVQQDGVLIETGSSLTIDRTAILEEAEETVDSPITGTDANEYIQVHITEENHKVTAVTVDFDPWEDYVVPNNNP